MEKYKDIIQKHLTPFVRDGIRAADAVKELKKDFVATGTVLVKIKNNRPEFIKQFDDARHSRYSQLVYVTEQLCQTKGLPDTEFLAIVSDGYSTAFPTFCPVRPPASKPGNIPFPMGNDRGGMMSTAIAGWDKRAEEVRQTHKHYPWEEKTEKAVFRGQYCWQTWAVGHYGEKTSEKWTDCARGLLFKIAGTKPALFDVGFTGKTSHGKVPDDIFDNVPVVDRIPLIEQQTYKYLINVGQNFNWADRLRITLFLNSAVILHEGGAEEFFYPMLEPYVHYIPTDILFSDLVNQVEWARDNDGNVRDMVKNMNDMAGTFLAEEAMLGYALTAITEYTKLLR